MDDIEPEKFNKFKEEAEKNYKTVGSVICPYLKATVAFNAKGLEHIKFKHRNIARSVKDQYLRFRLLKLAPDMIKKSHTLQEYFRTRRFEPQKTNSRWKHKMVDVVYYGFIAIVANIRIKVVLKKVEEGDAFFWSIIPFWKNEYKNSQNKKIFHVGDLEID